VLLVAGTSLAVQSGLRFVRRAHREQIPVVLVNRGPTRGDDLVSLRLDAGCSPTLTALADALAGTRADRVDDPLAQARPA
jgi:NAD-dependent SIR2 family protein deacetylase